MKLVVFDLDNVIIDGEIIDEIGKLVESKDKIVEITEQAMQGELDFETAIKERVKLLEGVPVEKVDEIAENMPLTQGVEETMASLKESAKLAIITGSFENIANIIKDKFSIDYVYSNVLEEKDGKLTGEVSGDLVSGSKADILAKIIEKENISLEECVAVGDGANDIPMIESAGLGIGFNPKPLLKEKADEIVESKSLKDILPIIEEYNSKLESSDEKEVKSEDEEAKKGEEVEEKEELEVTTENAPQLKDEKERLISQITEERDELNKTAREQKKIRDTLNAELKENLNNAIEYRDKRNKINEEVEENKKQRDKVNDELKKLEWSSGRRDRIKIENEIKKIDKIIETSGISLNIKKENQLAKSANDLRKKLVSIQEDEKVKESSKELKKTSEEYHEKVVELSEQAQEYHEKMLEFFKKTDEIRKDADESHKQFIQTRKKASAKHEEFKSVLNDIHKINKVLSTMKTRRRSGENKVNKKKNREEKEKAEDIMEKFKAGKKLSTEELLLLQKHNIV